MTLEPAKAYWTIAIAGSLALHAGAVGAAVTLIGNLHQETVVTEISFSDAPPAAVAPVVRSAQTVTVSRLTASHADRVLYQPLESIKPAAAVLSQPVTAAPAATATATATATVHNSVQSPLMAGAVPHVPSEAAAVAGKTAETARATPANIGRAHPPARTGTAQSTTRAEIALPAAQSRVSSNVVAAEEAISAPLTAPHVGRVPAETAMSSQGEDPLPTAPAGATAIASANSAPQRLQPSTPPARAVGVAPEARPSAAPAKAPIVGSTEIVALLVPARPGSDFGSETDQPSRRYREIIDFIRNFDGGDCFVALPSIGVENSVEFQTFGKDKAREGEFANAYAEALGIAADVSLGNVADAQCLALSFAQGIERYPAFSLIVELESAEVTSGSILSGTVLNVRDRPVHLLLIDDEGRVQAMDRFLSASDGTDRQFSAPLTLTSGPVATKQLLMAIVADRPVETLERPVNEPATEFFVRLADEIAASGADIDIALEAFSVF